MKDEILERLRDIQYMLIRDKESKPKTAHNPSYIFGYEDGKINGLEIAITLIEEIDRPEKEQELFNFFNKGYDI